MTIEDILKRKTVEATVVNQYGEGVYLGAPEIAKHNKYDYSFTWKASTVQHKSPFDTLMFHVGDKILKIIPVSVFRMDRDIRSLTIHMS